jgi:hypothetical protein
VRRGFGSFVASQTNRAMPSHWIGSLLDEKDIKSNSKLADRMEPHLKLFAPKPFISDRLLSQVLQASARLLSFLVYCR